MIGSGIASSLFHEAGHQGSDLLNLVDSLRSVLSSGRKCRAVGSEKKDPRKAYGREERLIYG
jgi:hypothetical protein